MGKRVVETYFHEDSGRWKNRIVGGPDLPNGYRHRPDAEREGRGFAEFLSCDFRVGDEPDPTPAAAPVATPARSHAVNGRIQALAARLERLESDDVAEVDDALRPELAAQVAGQLAETAHEYADLAHRLAAQVHRTEADQLDDIGETERATLQRKAAQVQDELAAIQRRAVADPHA